MVAGRTAFAVLALVLACHQPVMAQGDPPAAFSSRLLGAPSVVPRWALQAGPEAAPGVGSPGAYFLRSLLLPGWGQYAIGAKTSARNFLLSELLLIGGAVAFKTYGDWLEDDFIAFAAAHAQIRELSAHEDQFWVDLGNFNSVDDFNEEKLRRRDTRSLRDPAGTEFWQWDTRANRDRFENMRIQRDQASERSSFLVAAVVVNHIISGIHAIWLAKRKNRRARQAGKPIGVGWRPVQGSPGGVLTFSFNY